MRTVVNPQVTWELVEADEGEAEVVLSLASEEGGSIRLLFTSSGYGASCLEALADMAGAGFSALDSFDQTEGARTDSALADLRTLEQWERSQAAEQARSRRRI